MDDYGYEVMRGLIETLRSGEFSQDEGIKAKFGKVPSEMIRDLSVSDAAIRLYAYLSWHCSESDDVEWRSLPFALVAFAFLKREDGQGGDKEWWGEMWKHFRELEEKGWIGVDRRVREDGMTVQCVRVFESQEEREVWQQEEEKAWMFSVFAWMEKGPRPGFVYLLKSPSTGHWKIGRTRNPADRRKTFNVKLPFDVEYEHLIPSNDMNKAEAMLHAKYADKRLDGEWFDLDDNDIDWIKSFDRLDMVGNKGG